MSNTSPIDRYEVTIEKSGDEFNASMFAVLDEDGETGDAIHFGYGTTLADAIESLADEVREDERRKAEDERRKTDAERRAKAKAQDLDALPGGRRYLDHEGDAWYQSPSRQWVYDPNHFYAPGDPLVFGDEPFSEEQVRASGPFTPKEEAR